MTASPGRRWLIAIVVIAVLSAAATWAPILFQGLVIGLLAGVVAELGR